MQDDKEELCASGLDESCPAPAPATEDSLETTDQPERLLLKRKLDEEMGGAQKRRLMVDETNSRVTMLLTENAGTEEENTENSSEGKEIREPSEQERRVIIMKGNLPKLALPHGWIALNHRSGGIIYLHKPTRVCTWSRPYHIGGGSVRKHDVPLAAIPCLHQKRGLTMEKEKSESTSTEGNISSSTSVNNGSSILNALNTGEQTTEEANPSEDAITENTTVSEEHKRSGLDVIMSLTDTNDVTEKDGVTGKSGVTARNGETVLNGEMEVTESSSVTELRCDVTEQSNVTQLSQASEDFEKRVLNGEMEATESGSVTEVMSDETEQSNVTQLSEDFVKRVLNGEMEVDDVTESNSVTEIFDMAEQSNVTQHSQAAESTNSIRGQECFRERPSSNQTESAATNSSSSSLELLEAGELGTYLSSIWEFQALTSDQERHAVIAQPQTVHDIELPSSLECHPYAVKGAESKKQQGKDCLLNTGGKTPVAILHEYCQRVLKTKPVYQSSECENAETPFLAEVTIDGIKYGSGSGSSKKLAKQIAAECTLEVLLPGVYTKIRDYQISEAELEFFDKVDVLDPRIPEFCKKTTLPNPSQILEECLKRNQGICSLPIQFTTVCGADRNLSYHITCGKHTATGPCKNKRLGKQLASQQILKKLHPHLEKWGALIRIYCDRPSGSIKKYKKDDSKSTSEQECDSDMLQNSDLLARLKCEMRKIRLEAEKAKSMDTEKNSTEPVFTVDM